MGKGVGDWDGDGGRGASGERRCSDKGEWSLKARGLKSYIGGEPNMTGGNITNPPICMHKGID